MSLSIAMVAGESSGDLLAGLLLRSLNDRLAGLSTFGIGGPRMCEEGFRADWSMEKLAVRGYVEVLRHYWEIAAIRRTLRARLLAERPAAFIGVDAPDFNLELEAGLREAGIPTIHFVGPSIWAWRRERLGKIARSVDHMLVLFPFEEEIYRNAGIAATYVGHPLAAVIPMVPDRAAARAALGLAQEGTVAAILPGSRMSEIKYIAPAFIRAAALLAARFPQLSFVIPTATAATRAYLESLVALHATPALRLQILDGQSHVALAAADAVLVASGTATLETALFKRPMVIAYRMALLSWLMMKKMGYLPWVGLPNILAREFLVPELLQDAATPEALAAALEFQLFDGTNRTRLEARFAEIHASLLRDTGAIAAEVVASLIRPGGPLG